MGVYLPDMEMPKPGEVIRIYNNGEARKCPVTEQKAFEVGIAVPVPAHGRLIDADALTISTAVPLDGKPYRYIHIDNIKAAPTIIPAEEEKS